MPEAVPSPATRPVVLVAMPWANLNQPSLQIGLLAALLERSGIAARAMHLNVEFFNFVSRAGSRPFSALDYLQRTNYSALSDFIFFVPPLLTPDHGEAEAAFFELVQPNAGAGVALRREFERAQAVRALVPAFLEEAAAEILASDPVAVGFTCTFNQLVPSLALARVLKERAPGLRIVFGGTNMTGDAGEICLRLCPWIDVVVRGEAEELAPRLFGALLRGEQPAPAPGLCHRLGGTVTVVPEGALTAAALAASPLPDFDDYFARLDRSPLASLRQRVVSLPLESSRGCRWGKNRCRFCGVRTEDLVYNRKSPERIADEVVALAERHKVLDIYLVDSDVHPRAVAAAFTEAKARGCEARPWLQTRPTMARADMEALAAAGIRRMFIGLENLSSPILKLMRKGAKAIQGIRCLKWGAELGIEVTWNFLYGFPDEDPAEYDAMLRLVPSLLHLHPPGDIGPFCLARLSDYYDNHAAFGIGNLAPARSGDTLIWRSYGADEADLIGLATYLDYRLAGQAEGEPHGAHASACVAALHDWQAAFTHSKGALTLRKGPGFLVVQDDRIRNQHVSHLLEGVRAAVYDACAEGADVERISAHLARQGLEARREEIEEVLAWAVEQRIAYREDGVTLALAIQDRGH